MLNWIVLGNCSDEAMEKQSQSVKKEIQRQLSQSIVDFRTISEMLFKICEKII